MVAYLWADSEVGLEPSSQAVLHALSQRIIIARLEMSTVWSSTVWTHLHFMLAERATHCNNLHEVLQQLQDLADNSGQIYNAKCKSNFIDHYDLQRPELGFTRTQFLEA